MIDRSRRESAKARVDYDSQEAALLRGDLFRIRFPLTTIATARSYGILTGPALVRIHSLLARSSSTPFTLATFSGGTISGGTPVTQTPGNFGVPGTPPLVSVLDGVTVDVTGTPIAEDSFDPTEVGRGAGGIGNVLAANTQYYLTATNDDPGPLEFGFVVGIAATEVGL